MPTKKHDKRTLAALSALRERSLWWRVCITTVDFILIGGIFVLIWRLSEDPIAGAASGLAILTGYLTLLRPRLAKPILMLFENVQRSGSDQAGEGSWFIRVGVGNYGVTPAENCVGRLIEVWTKEGEWIDRFDPFDLLWARQSEGESTPVTIRDRGDFCFLDIAHVKESREPLLSFRIDLPPGQALVRDEEHSPGGGPVLRGGIYSIRVGVYADGSNVDSAWFEIDCSQPVTAASPPKIKQIEEPAFASGGDGE